MTAPDRVEIVNSFLEPERWIVEWNCPTCGEQLSIECESHEGAEEEVVQVYEDGDCDECRRRRVPGPGRMAS